MEERKIKIEYEDRLATLQRLLDVGDYDLFINSAGVLLEEILLKCYKSAFADLSMRQRKDLLEIEEDFNVPNGVDGFGIGRLVGLYQRTNFIEVLEKLWNLNLSSLKAFDLRHFANLRNDRTHPRDEVTSISLHEVKMIHDYILMWLAYLGYANLEGEVVHQSNKVVEKPNETAKRTEGLRIPKKKATSSNYSASYRDEEERLTIQANNTLKIDRKAFNHVLENFSKSINLVGLDLGCAAGHVTKTRFPKNKFDHILGIDHNPETIEKAGSNTDTRFTFKKQDLESSMISGTLKSYLHEKKLEGFDVVYSALTLHHLKNPQKLLGRLRSVMSPKSYIILRGSDDGSKICSPGSDIMQRIINLTLQANRVSDRLNGRKLFPLLVNTGYDNIKFFYQVKDTTTLSYKQRADLFRESFSYRIDYFEKNLLKNPNSIELTNQRDEVQELLDELEDLFLRKDFYYSETDYVIVGKLDL